MTYIARVVRFFRLLTFQKFCQSILIENKHDYEQALNHLCKVHSTAFYLKATISVLIKAQFNRGLRLPWSFVESTITRFRENIEKEQKFSIEMLHYNDVLSKIDSTASIVLSSKLAYQLTKLSE